MSEPLHAIADDAAFAAFERELGLGRRCFSGRETCKILGVSDRSLDRLIANGQLEPPFTVGAQKQGFWSGDLARVLWRAKKAPPAAAPPPARKPRSPKQMNPRRGRGRPRKGGTHRVAP